MHLLQSVYDIWASRSANSQDAKYASQVLRAVLNKIGSSSFSLSSASDDPTYEHSANELGAYYLPSSMPSTAAGVLCTGPGGGFVGGDPYAFTYDDFPPVDSFFGTTAPVDWVRSHG